MPVALCDVALRILADRLSDGVILFDDQGRVCMVNAAAERLIGGDPWTIYGCAIPELVHGRLRVPLALGPRLRAGEIVDCRVRDGLPRSLRVQQLRLPEITDAAGSTSTVVPRMALLLEDRTAQCRVRSLQRVSISEFAAAMPVPDTSATPVISRGEIQQALVQELRFAGRQGDHVGVVFVLGDRPRASETALQTEDILASSMWADRMVGRADPDVVTGIESLPQGPWSRVWNAGVHLPGPRDVEGVACWVIILPGAAAADCEAEILRLGGLLAQHSIRRPRFGAACIVEHCVGRAGGAEAPAIDLLLAARKDAQLRELDERRRTAARIELPTTVGAGQANLKPGPRGLKDVAA